MLDADCKTGRTLHRDADPVNHSNCPIQNLRESESPPRLKNLAKAGGVHFSGAGSHRYADSQNTELGPLDPFSSERIFSILSEIMKRLAHELSHGSGNDVNGVNLL